MHPSEAAANVPASTDEQVTAASRFVGLDPEQPTQLELLEPIQLRSKLRHSVLLNALVSEQIIISGPASSTLASSFTPTMEIENEDHDRSFGAAIAGRGSGVRRGLSRFRNHGARLLRDARSSW
jgi:hypothetical protein